MKRILIRFFKAGAVIYKMFRIFHRIYMIFLRNCATIGEADIAVI